MRSAQAPETSFRRLAIASARPSIAPSANAPPPESVARKAGKSATIISLAMSARKLTQPRARTSRGSFLATVEQREHALLDGGHRDDAALGLAAARAPGLRREEHRAFLRRRGQEAVAAAHERRVERDHVHQVAHPELLLRQAPGDVQPRQRELRIEEELAGVVARLAVDVDGAREVGLGRRVGPVVVREPRIALGQRDELARARVVEAELALSLAVEHDPCELFLDPE